MRKNVSYRGLVRLGGVSAVLSALLGVLSLVFYLIVVGGDSLSEAATSATFFLPSGAQLLAMLLLRSVSWRCMCGKRRPSGHSALRDFSWR
jgi:hypothetical protein